MSFNTLKLLQKQKNNILEIWMKNQLTDEGLREDLISNEDLRDQSDVLVGALITTLSNDDLYDMDGDSWNSVIEIL